MNNHKNTHLVFSLSLLLIFVVGSFFVLLYETKGYSKIQDTIVKQDNTYMPLSYISTKYKTNDEVYIEEIEDTDCLVFKQEGMKTYIYFDEGYLKELYASEEYSFSLNEGNELFEVDDMSIDIADGLLSVIIVMDNEVNALNIHLLNGGN